MPIRKVFELSQVTQTLKAKDQEISQKLLKAEVDGWPIFTTPLLKARAEAYGAFRAKIREIAGLRDPLSSLTFLFKDGGTNYYDKPVGSWRAFYYEDADREAAVLFYVSHNTVKKENLVAELANRREA